MPRSCHRVYCMCTKFGVDSSSRFSHISRTARVSYCRCFYGRMKTEQVLIFQTDDSEDTQGMVFHGSKRLSRHEYSLRMYSSDVQVCHHFVTVVDHGSRSRTAVSKLPSMLNASAL